MTIALLSSGNIGFHICEKILEEHKVDFIFTDKRSTDIIELAKENNIDIYIGNPRSSKAKDIIERMEVDVLISINYLFIIKKDLISSAKKLAFNIHGSLLPKYRGRTPHVWAIINNEKETGITAHKIDSGCDTGDIIRKERIEITDDDTGASLLNKFKKMYFPIVNSILNDLGSGNIISYEQDDKKATYFGKRTPDDGHIDWNWQFLRIYNWVRAQASPYPGAFTYYEGQKLIIDQVKRSPLGFSENVENGTILSTDPLVVKCPNTAIEVVKHREFPVEIRTNKKLY